MNIGFVYLYRDASNYKSWGSVVFEEPTSIGLSIVEAEAQIRTLFMNDTFSAHQLSLPELFTYVQGSVGHDDHCLHEFNSLELTEEESTDALGRSFSQFLQQVTTAFMGGWEGFDPTTPSREDRVFRFSF